MGEFAEAAERVVTASEEASATDDVSVDTSSAPDDTPAPATVADPAPSAPGEASASVPSEDRGGRGPDGRFARSPKAENRYQQLANQNRTFKAENERLKKLEQAFGWLKPDHAPVMQSFYERFQVDPDQALIVETLERLKHSPQALARYKQALGEHFAEQKADAEAVPDPEPQPDYETEDGQQVYSAARAKEWQTWRERQLKAEFQKDIAPLKELAQERQQEKVFARLSQQAKEHAKSVVTPLLANPLFAQHRPAIRAKYRELVQQAHAQGREIDGKDALHRAYIDVLQSVASQQHSAGARAFATALQAKPGASALNPARPVASAAAPRPTSFGEAAAKILGVR